MKRERKREREGQRERKREREYIIRYKIYAWTQPRMKLFTFFSLWYVDLKVIKLILKSSDQWFTAFAY